MSEDDSDDQGEVENGPRTVTPLSKPHRNSEMDVFGWVYFVVLLVLAIPVLPLFVLYWVVDKAVGAFGGDGENADESTG